MDTFALIFAIMTVALVWVTYTAWRMGNEKRDVSLLGVFSGLFGMGTVISAVL
ncbi:MAG: hypothetical protein LH480_09045 [Rubrivivax sp.]|nr:hypothetical protein [Rubrivivax sp.]